MAWDFMVGELKGVPVGDMQLAIKACMEPYLVGVRFVAERSAPME